MPFDKKRLDRVFNPKTVVVVGDKKAGNYSWLRSMQTVKGKLYSVQVSEDEIPGIQEMGVTNYTSLLDVPGPIDYVLLSVPRKVAPMVLADCVKAKVGGVSLFTSGFAETDDEGRALQKQIAAMAVDAGMPLIGPNCMGLFNPKAGVRHSVDQYHGESGPVAFLGQSGTHTIFFCTTLEAIHGIKLAKSVSFGNAAVMDVADYIEYFSQDPEVKVIGAYIEGVKEGAPSVRGAEGGRSEDTSPHLEGGPDRLRRPRRQYTHRIAGGLPGYLGHGYSADWSDPREQPG